MCHLNLINGGGKAMGLTYIDGVVTGPAGQHDHVRFLVDSGASYSLLAEDIWKHIKLTPRRRMQFMLADGTVIERDVSECHLQTEHGEGHTPVILGEPGDASLLGAVTLEILGVVWNPFSRNLQPMKMSLAGCRIVHRLPYIAA